MSESADAKPQKPGVSPIILLTMTGVTGIVDAVSYLALGHVFTANMTGNVVLLGFALAGTEGLSVERSLLALFCFFLGAIAGGRISIDQAPRAFAAEAILLIIAAAIAYRLGVPSGLTPVATYGIIATTAVAMGLRNAVVRKLAVPDLTTTVLTLTITGLAADSSLAHGENPRWQRRCAAVIAMLAGAAAGAILVRRSIALPLGIAAGTTAACVLVAYSPHRKDAN
jgi:uncharacterized membrane protein YoaK (UPF0700 family)